MNNWKTTATGAAGAIYLLIQNHPDKIPTDLSRKSLIEFANWILPALIIQALGYFARDISQTPTQPKPPVNP